MIKILAISKSEKHNYFRLEKVQEFVSGFRKFLVDIGFDEHDVGVYSFGRPVDEHGEPDENKEDDVKNYVDKRFGFDNDEYTIDVVFGKENIFVMIFTKINRQKEIVEGMSKFCSF